MCAERSVWIGMIKKGRLRKLPAFLFLLVAGVLVVSIVAISIASLPLGIGSLARELLGAVLLVWTIFFVSKVIHNLFI